MHKQGEPNLGLHSSVGVYYDYETDSFRWLNTTEKVPRDMASALRKERDSHFEALVERDRESGLLSQ